MPKDVLDVIVILFVGIVIGIPIGMLIQRILDERAGPEHILFERDESGSIREIHYVTKK